MPRRGRLGQVTAVLGQRLVRLLRVGRRHAVVPAHGTQSPQQRVLRHPDLVGQGQQEVLDRDVVVAEITAVLVGRLEDGTGLTRDARLRAALGPGQPGQLGPDPLTQHIRVNAHLGQQGSGHRLVLRQKGVEQMGRRQLRIVGRRCMRRRHAERGLRVVGPAFWIYRHVSLTSSCMQRVTGEAGPGPAGTADVWPPPPRGTGRGPPSARTSGARARLRVRGPGALPRDSNPSRSVVGCGADVKGPRQRSGGCRRWYAKRPRAPCVHRFADSSVRARQFGCHRDHIDSPVGIAVCHVSPPPQPSTATRGASSVTAASDSTAARCSSVSWVPAQSLLSSPGDRPACRHCDPTRRAPHVPARAAWCPMPSPTAP